MKDIIADLHIHSRFSRATSKNITIPKLAEWAKIKGLNLLGTGDFSHPEWFQELKGSLKEENGLFYYNDFPFILSNEISLVYTKGKGRRIHLVFLAPSLEVVEQISAFLRTKGRLDYDGRPIFGMSAAEFVENMLSISKDIEIIPAHAWTPWFGVFGSMSGFDSLNEAFDDKEKYIHAIETGMSSDPEMNWRLSFLNSKSIISFSDSHSFWPWRLGREATIFNGKDDEKKESENFGYKDIITQIRENSFKATVETAPEYGKYHYDGHRLCNFSCSPEESKKINGICPKCHKPLIIGVESRVEQLADNPRGFKPENAKPFFRILPLHEIIALAKETALSGRKCWEYYNNLIKMFGNEFSILLDAEEEKLAKFDAKLAEAIMLNRKGKIKVKPGYDGEYGVAILPEKQAKLV